MNGEAKRRRSVLVVDDDEDLRTILVECLTKLVGVDALSAAGLHDLAHQEQRVLRCSLAMLDLNLGAGKPSGLDAYRWLRARGFAGRVAFLTGHARSHPHAMAAAEIGDSEILAKPVGVDRIRRLVEGVRD